MIDILRNAAKELLRWLRSSPEGDNPYAAPASDFSQSIVHQKQEKPFIGARNLFIRSFECTVFINPNMRSDASSEKKWDEMTAESKKWLRACLGVARKNLIKEYLKTGRTEEASMLQSALQEQTPSVLVTLIPEPSPPPLTRLGNSSFVLQSVTIRPLDSNFTYPFSDRKDASARILADAADRMIDVRYMDIDVIIESDNGWSYRLHGAGNKILAYKPNDPENPQRKNRPAALES